MTFYFPLNSSLHMGEHTLQGYKFFAEDNKPLYNVSHAQQ